MKIVLSTLIILVSCMSIVTPILADIRCDQATGKFYCYNPPIGINQDEYNDLVWRVLALRPSNPYSDMDFIASGMLRMIGTATAIQVLNDLQKISREARADSARFYS
jgi:hypothetical protein